MELGLTASSAQPLSSLEFADGGFDYMPRLFGVPTLCSVLKNLPNRLMPLS